jgi:hypothetical protein
MGYRSKITARELSKQDPERFQKEYWDWVEYALDYDWWECVEADLIARLEPAGVGVESIAFSVSYSQGDYATFNGYIDVAKWMETAKDGDQTYAQKYPALALAIEDYGERASVSTLWRRCGASVNFDGAVVGNTPPAGVFKLLDDEAWDELIAQQYSDADIESAMQEYVDQVSSTLYDDLRNEHEHLTSEESFIESCECNEILFDLEECTA